MSLRTGVLSCSVSYGHSFDGLWLKVVSFEDRYLTLGKTVRERGMRAFASEASRSSSEEALSDLPPEAPLSAAEATGDSMRRAGSTGQRDPDSTLPALHSQKCSKTIKTKMNSL